MPNSHILAVTKILPCAMKRAAGASQQRSLSIVTLWKIVMRPGIACSGEYRSTQRVVRPVGRRTAYCPVADKDCRSEVRILRERYAGVDARVVNTPERDDTLGQKGAFPLSSFCLLGTVLCVHASLVCKLQNGLHTVLCDRRFAKRRCHKSIVSQEDYSHDER